MKIYMIYRHTYVCIYVYMYYIQPNTHIYIDVIYIYIYIYVYIYIYADKFFQIISSNLGRAQNHLATHLSSKLKNNMFNIFDRFVCVEGSMRCLGHFLTENSSISIDFRETIRGIWSSFWRNCGQGLRRANEAAQANFMRASLRSIASFRWSRWPWQKKYADRLDSLQRHLVSCIRPVRPLPGERAEAYFKRRHVVSSRVVRQWGPWSQQWAQSCVRWNAHILRANDPSNWGLTLRHFHGDQWISQQRFENSSQSHWGRTRTRSFAGRPATRWHEGVQAARALLHTS